MIEEGNTIPFIARYRKEETGGMSDEVLREFEQILKQYTNLLQRKEEVARLIDEQGKYPTILISLSIKGCNKLARESSLTLICSIFCRAFEKKSFLL